MRRDETYDLVHSYEALLPPMSGGTLRKITRLYEQSSLYGTAVLQLYYGTSVVQLYKYGIVIHYGDPSQIHYGKSVRFTMAKPPVPTSHRARCRLFTVKSNQLSRPDSEATFASSH